MPLISVLMGTFNESRQYVAQAVRSIRRQTFRDFEFLICDDGSKPEFYRWLQEYCSQDARIKLIRNEKNCGLAQVLNRCLKLATGAYIARMDADDISSVKRLEKQAVFLHQHREYAFVGCNVYLVDDQGVWGIRRLEQIPKKESFLSTSPFVHPAVMFRQGILTKLHGYCQSPKVLRTEDYELFMRLYAAGYQGYNLQEPLLAYREERKAYQKRQYHYRLNECRVRYHGFLQLGILKGNLRYVVKPLAVGVVPAGIMRLMRVKKYAAWSICLRHLS